MSVPSVRRQTVALPTEPAPRNQPVMRKTQNCMDHVTESTDMGTTTGLRCPSLVDSKTGMVVNLRVLKSIAQQYVVELIDHRNLDVEVEYFATRPSTTENLAVMVWQQMSVGLKENGLSESLLDDVTIQETDANSVSYSGKSV
ncbi:6-pyruvoyl tetrahydrobiopterin synthase [Ceratobasidium sp. AG-Ba]|nr:6-pyruvoyl tetrahydrobiopterin synthase [Ceratobasidium sp. AG-Ba]